MLVSWSKKLKCATEVRPPVDIQVRRRHRGTTIDVLAFQCSLLCNVPCTHYNWSNLLIRSSLVLTYVSWEKYCPEFSCAKIWEKRIEGLKLQKLFLIELIN